ncbi:sensor histidine kinase [Pseudonocardia xinjiangensis]|uniref:histidine kinase n=1 Tax=Pseudonocardia xinjiangensis TaxID=75289 RepID=A0ABX1RKJ9_9PSEU|nr:sensor histidine kinase [Pseudonocardia xinjiangensis]NMH80868.1 sensor histidine kinase [Pseudonocardia xinjiangensis]
MTTASPRSAWEALAAGPVRFLRTSWPWRVVGWALSGCLVAVVWTVAFLGLVVVPVAALLALLTGVGLADVERRRLRLVDRTAAPSPHARPRRPGFVAWFATRFREVATWRELGYAVVFALVLAWLDAAMGLVFCLGLAVVLAPVLIALTPQVQPDELVWFGPYPLLAQLGLSLAGLLLLPVLAYLVTAYVAARVALTRVLLVGRGGPAPHAEVAELTRSRVRLVEAMDAQRRRIERDLHDGAQQRLTGVAMTLGLARLELDGTTGPARELVDRAYEQSRLALAELRELVHGIHPQALVDSGLPAALATLADRSPVPVQLDVTLPARPPAEVEAAAWFIAGEALANVAKHSGAAQAWVRARTSGGAVVLEIGDDGRGGADPAGGTGLVGLADRVSVLGGRITLSSPDGGPTLLTVELPCGP